jgi:hypothetical protein
MVDRRLMRELWVALALALGLQRELRNILQKALLEALVQEFSSIETPSYAPIILVMILEIKDLG